MARIGNINHSVSGNFIVSTSRAINVVCVRKSYCQETLVAQQMFVLSV